MSQRLLMGLVMLLGMANATSYGQQSDSEKAAIRKWKIKETTQLLTYQDSQGQSYLQLKNTWEYDKNGNLIEEIGYTDPAGKPKTRVQYTYDSRNNLIGRAVDGATQLTVAYKYDKNGQSIGGTIFNRDGSVKETQTVTRNGAGKTTEQVSYDAAGKLLKRLTYKYDSAGNAIEYAEFSPTGNLMLRNVNSFDAEGNGTQILRYDSAGSLSGKTVYVYDKTEHLIEQTEFAPDGSVRTRTTFQRDPQGFVVQSTESDKATGQVTITKSTYEFFK